MLCVKLSNLQSVLVYFICWCWRYHDLQLDQVLYQQMCRTVVNLTSNFIFFKMFVDTTKKKLLALRKRRNFFFVVWGAADSSLKTWWYSSKFLGVYSVPIVDMATKCQNHAFLVQNNENDCQVPSSKKGKVSRLALAVTIMTCDKSEAYRRHETLMSKFVV